ncbi:hypothetical protein DSECCO2_660530 [anaerobic digester metagenome]
MQRFLEVAADAHGLAHALHGRGQVILGTGELLEGETRDLDHAVVDGGLEGGHGFARDVVGDLVEGVAHGQLGRDLGDGETRGLARQGGGPRHARVHLDDHHFAVFGIDRELDVGAAGLDADLAHDGQRGVAHLLVFFVGKRLDRRDRGRVAGVHAHGVDIFDGADDDAVVRAVAHDLELEFLPAEHRTLQHDFALHAGGQTHGGDFLQVFHVVGHAAARAAERVGRAHDDGERDALAPLPHVVHGVADAALGNSEADVFHGLAEKFAGFRLFDDVERRADEFHAVFGQDAGFGQGHGGIEAGLAAEGRQEGVGLFPSDDAGHGPGLDGFDVGAVGQLRVGHDGGRVGVDQDHLVAFFLEGLGGLGAGIVELAGLADDDGPRADDHDLLDVRPFGHGVRLVVRGGVERSRTRKE